MGTRRSYLPETVFEAAQKRIEWLFSEFPNVYVNYSGGKDSTVCLYLTLIVAERLGRLPVNVLFVDQEAEWQTVIDHIREVMVDPRVNPVWLQVPIKIFNATSNREEWLIAWEPGKKWIRHKEPGSIKENVFGVDRLSKMFSAVKRYYHPDEPCCTIAGVRCEESPARARGLVTFETYKGETWGKKEDERRRHFAFYPIYDWSYRDVWKAIHDNGWPYCQIYDFMYQYGVPLRNMRVSNLHHETAVNTLFYLQEIEADTWDRVVERIPGINTAGQLAEQWLCPRELPFMFQTWVEYRDHLIDNLITNQEDQDYFRRKFTSMDKLYVGKTLEELHRTEIAALLVNDYHGTKLTSFAAAHMNDAVNRGKHSGRTHHRTH